MSAPTKQEYIDAANAAYADAAAVPSSDPLHPELTALLDSNLQPVKLEIDSDGFYAEAYVDSQNNVIIAFEGSNLDLTNTSTYAASSRGADLQLADGQTPDALLDAILFAATVKKDAGTDPIYVTGHSLGGAEAEEAIAANVDQFIIGGMTFGAPGLPGFNGQSPNPNAANLIDYIDYGDPVGNYASDSPSELNGIAKTGSHVGKVELVGSGSQAALLRQADQGWNKVIQLSAELYGQASVDHALANYAVDLGVRIDGSSIEQTNLGGETSVANSIAAQSASKYSTNTPSGTSYPIITGPPTTAAPTNTLSYLSYLFPATEEPTGTSNHIQYYSVVFVRGPGDIIVGSQSYSLGSAIPELSSAQFDSAYFSSTTSGVSEIEVTAFDNAGNSSNEADVTIAVTAPANAPQAIVATDHTPPTIISPSQQFAVGVGGNATLSSANLSVTDANSADYTPAQLTYKVISGPTDGYLLKEDSIVTSFTQADINNGLIEYQENGTSASNDSFTYYVSDPAGNRSGNVTSDITINSPPSSTHPALTTDSALSVGQGLSTLISDSNLDVTDSGLNSWQIVYTITGGPSHGEVVVGGSQPVTSFTQQELDLGLIEYVNTGNVSGTDSFNFTVSDGRGGSIGQSTFDINVIPKNNLSVTVERPLSNDQEPDNPVIPGTNTPRAYSLVDSDVLTAIDPGVAPQNVTYTVVSVPANALGFRVGTWNSNGSFMGSAPVTTFTQAEVDAGEVFYAQPFGPVDISGDQVNVVLSASDNVGNSVSNITLPVILYPNGLLSNGTFTPANQVVADTVSLTAPIGQPIVIGPGLINYLSPWFTSSQIEYALASTPSDGTLYLNGQPLSAIHPFNQNSTQVFTQQEVDDGDITYVENSSSGASDSFELYLVDPYYLPNNVFTFQVSVTTTGTDGGKVASGSAGDETLIAGAGNNYFIGDGSTTVSYANSPNGVSVNVANRTATNGYGGTDTLSNIHSFVGSSAGSNIVTFDGAHTSYNYQELNSGWFQVTDLRAGSPDGTDQFQNIQTFTFSDGTYTQSQLLTPTNPTPSPSTTAVMIMTQASNGAYEIYDLGKNSVLAGYSLTQAGSPWRAVGLGGFDAPDSSDLLLRNSTGAFEIYDVSGNTASGPFSMGGVGPEWSVLALGDFSGNAGETDMIMRDSVTGALECYDISNNQVAGAAAMGGFGSEWSFVGVGDFSSNPNETDMLMRDVNTGAFEVYDIRNNAIVGAQGMGGVGSEWQFVGVGDFSSNPGETDMLMRDVNTGAFEVYDIRDNAVVGAQAMGGVGSEWQFVGVGDFSGNAGETDLLMRDVINGNLELYDIRNDTVASAQSAGGLGTEWKSVGVAPYQSAGAAVASSGSLSSVATTLDIGADAAPNLAALLSPSAAAGASGTGGGTQGLPQIDSFTAPMGAAPGAQLPAPAFAVNDAPSTLSANLLQHA